jgi:hypothetical protein
VVVMTMVVGCLLSCISSVVVMQNLAMIPPYSNTYQAFRLLVGTLAGSPSAGSSVGSCAGYPHLTVNVSGINECAGDGLLPRSSTSREAT